MRCFMGRPLQAMIRRNHTIVSMMQDARYEAYSVGTTISEIMVNAADSSDSVVSLVVAVKSLVGFPIQSGVR
jgi:hypothetical protein